MEGSIVPIVDSQLEPDIEELLYMFDYLYILLFTLFFTLSNNSMILNLFFLFISPLLLIISLLLIALFMIL